MNHGFSILLESSFTRCPAPTFFALLRGIGSFVWVVIHEIHFVAVALPSGVPGDLLLLGFLLLFHVGLGFFLGGGFFLTVVRDGAVGDGFLFYFMGINTGGLSPYQRNSFSYSTR